MIIRVFPQHDKTPLLFYFYPLHFNTYKIAEQEKCIKLTKISNPNSN